MSNKELGTASPAAKRSGERPWTVDFDRRWGGPGTIVFPGLEDWTAHSDPGVRHYSGKARYRTRFAWSGSGGGGRLALALGKVCNIASVRLNGHDLGIAWCEPWRLEIPRHALRQGENELVITVANLWLNRLIGDRLLPPDKRVTWTPDCPTNSRSIQKTPLLPSGLLGPVSILALD